MQYPVRTFAGFRTYLRALAFVPALAALGIAAPAAQAPAQAAAPRAHHSPSCASTSDVTLDFVAADINDVLKALSMQTHVNIVSGADVKGTVTVSLAHVTLEDALDLVTRLSGYQYAKVGRTYVVGTPSTIATLTASGVAAAPTQTAVLSYLYSAPEDLTGTLKQILPNLQVTPGKTTGGQGGVLIVSGTEAQVAQAREIVGQSESLLSRNIATNQTVLYNIKYASADDLEAVLGRLVPGVVVTPAPTQGFRLQAPATADAGGTTSTTTSFGATTAGATVTATTGNAPVKPTTYSLLLTGEGADIARAQQILATVDVRPAQINYEAKVTEINLNDVKNLGLTYDFSGASTRIGEFIDNTNKVVDPKGPTLGDNGFGGAKRFINISKIGRTAISNFVTVGLNALFQSGDAKLLSSPNISAVDGQPAATFIGDNVTYIASVTTGPTGQNITTATASAGIKLFVTGKVNNDGYVTVNIHPEVSTLRLVPSLGGAQLPQISTREATTTVRVRDGETIAIGGLISQQDVKNIQKVPLLGDLPFFGQLFRNTNTTHNRDEVVIFIKVSTQKDPI